MFHDLDKTLERLLDDAAVPSQLRNAGVSFESPDDSFKPQNPDSAINLFLYEVKENRELRDPVPITEISLGTFTRRLPPLRVDCSYLVTAWKDGVIGATKIQAEHQLLGQAFVWLSRFPTIPEKYRFGTLKNPQQAFPPPAIVAQWDAAKNQGEFWNALGIAPRPYFNLVVTIAMDLNQYVEGAVVTTAITGYRQGNDVVSQEERILIGGMVLNKNKQPVSDAWVRLEQTGETYVTKADGRFIFAGAKRGSGYTLRARARGLGEVSRIDLEVPSLSGEYNLQFS
jgi:hypothetical protein